MALVLHLGAGLGLAVLVGGCAAEPGPERDTGTVHSCVWPADDFCREYNDRSADVGVDVEEAAAQCAADATYFSEDGVSVYVPGPCEREVQGTSEAVARCVLPEEGESIIGGVRAGQPYVLIRYYYKGYAGMDFEPEPISGAEIDFLPLEALCRADEGVFQRAPFSDFDWFVAPQIVAVDHVCTPGAQPEQDVWDYTITTAGLVETNGTAAVWFTHDSASPPAETHDLAGDGTTMSVHLVVAGADTQLAGTSTAFTCGMESHMSWAAYARRPEAQGAASCMQWYGDDYSDEIVPFRGNCIVAP